MEITDYIVRYTAGGSYGQIIVMAHNKEEAAKIAEMQVRYGCKKGGRFRWLSILTREESEALKNTPG
jgi:hypothetical protein